MNLEVGTQLGDYRILSRIGSGAYGVVFRAEHSITRRIDAVKLMLDAGSSSAIEEQRFLREIQAQASLQHPNIAAVYGAFRTPWGLALAMELVNGQSLRTFFQNGPLEAPAAAAYILQVLDGLNCAGKVGVVHRDIKPDNILITPDGTVKLTDFGLAQVTNRSRITSSGENLGTPCYMSPEQVMGSAPADSRTDVYSTGVVLYEAVTGRPPFIGTNGFAVMLAHQNSAPVSPLELNPSIGPLLNRVILTALEKDPARRFQTANEFRAALEDALSSVSMVVPTMQVPLPSGPRDGGIRFAAVAAILAGSLCGFGAWAGHVTAQRIAPPPVPVARPVLSAPLPDPAPLADPVPAAVPAPVATPALHRAARAPKTPLRHREIAFTPAPHDIETPVQAKRPAIPPETAVAPALPPEPVAAGLPPAIAPPLPSGTAAEKRRNIVRRAFGKIFGHRAEPGSQAAVQR